MMMSNRSDDENDNDPLKPLQLGTTVVKPLSC